MHTLVADLRKSAEIIFLVTSNVHDARSKALIDLADSVILEVIQGVSSYRDLYSASNDYPFVADKLLGVVYVSNAVSRGRRAAPPAKPTDTVRGTGEQTSSGKTTSADSELGSESEIAPVGDDAPDDLTRPDDIALDDTIRPGDIAPIRPDDIAPDHMTTPDDVAPDDMTRPDDETYDPPPWSNGAVRGIAATEQTSPSVRDNDLAVPWLTGR